MLLAVPSIVLIAASTDAAFMSGNLYSAISLSFSSVIEPILLLLGSPDPFEIPASRFNNSVLGPFYFH